MFTPYKKEISWKKKDYFLTIFNFFLNYLLLCVIVLGTIMLYSGNETKSMFDGFSDYFRLSVSLSNRDVNMFIYTFIALFVITVSIYLFFYFEYKNFLVKSKNIMLIFSIITLSLVICILTGKYLHMYARPMAMCALLALLLVNKKSAIFLNFCFCIIMFTIDVLICDVTGSTLLREAPMFLSLTVGCATGLFAIYLVDGVGSRIKVFGKGFVISIPVLIAVFAIQFDVSLKILDVARYLLYGVISGVTSVVYMMTVVPVFESIFNVLTNYKLAELTDHKDRLLTRLRTEAPGTFNHSLVVSTLAESCASAIGENALLARAAGYYHDMGKLSQPLYFTENQHGVNPHDELTPELSTEIIRSHTKNGYDFLKKHRVPQFLADVAREHHGTLPITYFYMKAQKFTEGGVDIKDFSYPGPKPQSKIAAIIMLADGCEAAVRAQNDRSHQHVEEVVRGIIEDRMNNDQFSDCDITLKEIDIIRSTLVDNLTGVYHDRINYPKLKIEHKPAQNSQVEMPTQQQSVENEEKPKKATRKKQVKGNQEQ